ncbi:MAG: AI-2E family transporter, partial [Verrucomicrobiaceae bacterium]
MDPTHPPANHETAARSHVQSFVLLMLTALGIALCYSVAAPFLPAMAWSLALAVLFTPAQQWLEVRLKSH